MWASVSPSPFLHTERPLWYPAEFLLGRSPRIHTWGLPIPLSRPPRYAPHIHPHIQVWEIPYTCLLGSLHSPTNQLKTGWWGGSGLGKGLPEVVA